MDVLTQPFPSSLVRVGACRNDALARSVNELLGLRIPVVFAGSVAGMADGASRGESGNVGVDVFEQQQRYGGDPLVAGLVAEPERQRPRTLRVSVGQLSSI
jgi:hypothetical protein